MRSARNTLARGSSALLLLFVVAGCAGDGELAAARDSWRGASYDQVVAAWGPPARTLRDSHTWSSEALVHRSGGGAGGALFGADSGPCERTLVIQERRVVRAGDWNGAAESCRRFARR
jgi:hypothetical protein